MRQEPSATPQPSAAAGTAVRDKKPGPSRQRGADLRLRLRWVPRLAGLTAMVTGLGEIAEGLLPGLYHRRLHALSDLLPGTLVNLTRTADVIIGLLLVMLSRGLRRRKRRAWAAAVAALAFSLAVHAGLGVVLQVLTPHRQWSGGVHPAAAALTLALLAVLYVARRQFYAVGDRRSRWRALAVVAGLVVADLVIGLAALPVIGGLAGRYGFGQRLASVVANTLGFSGPVRFLTEGGTDHFSFVTGGLGLFTLAAALWLFLRPAGAGAVPGADAARVRQLLGTAGGQDSLGYFTLRDDKSVIFSPSGKSCIGYRVLSGVMLAGGDPLGDPEAWPGAIHAFLDEAARHAWIPAVLGCSERAAEAWCREGGLTALELGDEAVVSAAGFSLDGRAMRNVRQMTSRVGRQGYTAQVRRVADIPRAEADAIARAAGSWRGSQSERGFSMALGRLGEARDGDCVVATATLDGTVRAVLHFVPWGLDGLSLDLMRRDRSAAPGLNDFLIVAALRAAGDLGVQRVSLNFAVFRAALERGERIGAGPVLRAWRRCLLFLSRWFQIESLYKFNAKFSPQWVPRFMVYPSTRDAPRIGLAALQAEAFLVWPQLRIGWPRRWPALRRAPWRRT